VALSPKGHRKIHPSRFKEASVARNVWAVVPEDGTPFESLLDPAYWAHVGERLRPTDRIEVFAEDGSYFAELMVRSAGRLFAHVEALRKHDFVPVAVSPSKKYEVEYKGPHLKHAVVRVADKSVMQSGFDTTEAALAWLSLNARSLAA
jgi:hypothetical protein